MDGIRIGGLWCPYFFTFYTFSHLKLTEICLFEWCLTAHQHKKAIKAKKKKVTVQSYVQSTRIDGLID